MTDKPTDVRVTQAYERAIKAIEPLDLTLEQAEVVLNVINDLVAVGVDVTADSLTQAFKDEMRVAQGSVVAALALAYGERDEAKRDILRLLDEAEDMYALFGEGFDPEGELNRILTTLAVRYRDGGAGEPDTHPDPARAVVSQTPPEDTIGAGSDG